MACAATAKKIYIYTARLNDDSTHDLVRGVGDLNLILDDPSWIIGDRGEVSSLVVYIRRSSVLVINVAPPVYFPSAREAIFTRTDCRFMCQIV